MRNLSLTAALAALALTPALSPAPALAQSGGPLGSIFGCGAAGNKQAGGAVAGAVVGGLLGNQVASKKNRGAATVLGAAVGAAAGSYIGCRMQTSDQAKAEAAAQHALNNGQTYSWNNPETGASGRTRVVSTTTTPYNGGGQAYAQPVSLQGVRFAPGVEPQGPYFGASGSFTAPQKVNMRGAPSTNAAVVGQLQAGATFDAMAKVRGPAYDWLLIGNNGVAIGYVAESVVRPQNPQAVYAGNGGAGGRGQMCRTFDQTLTTGAGETETNRYTACQNPNGEWVVQG